MDMHELFTLHATYADARKEARALFLASFDQALQQPELWHPLRIQNDRVGRVNAHREVYGEARLNTSPITCPEPLGSLLTLGFAVGARRVWDASGGLYVVTSASSQAPTQLRLLVRPLDDARAAPDCETALDWSELRRRVAREDLRELRGDLAERREELKRLRAEYRGLTACAQPLREAARRK